MDAADQAQPTLWPEAETITDRYGCGSFTGERLAAQEPERYRAIVDALANGLGIRQIARAFKVSPNTVAAVRAREGKTIDTLKTSIANRALLGAEMAVERLIDEMGDIKREALPVVAGILIDKAQLLTGQATSIFGRPEAPQDWESALDSIRQAKGQTIDTTATAGTGIIPHDTQTKGAPAALPEPRPAAWPMGPDCTPQLIAGDSQSLDYPSKDGDSVGFGHAVGHAGHVDTAAAGTHDRHEDTTGPRGGGGSAALDGPVLPIHPASENFETKEQP